MQPKKKNVLSASCDPFGQQMHFTAKTHQGFISRKQKILPLSKISLYTEYPAVFIIFLIAFSSE